jgi:hypothetical protein
MADRLEKMGQNLIRGYNIAALPLQGAFSISRGSFCVLSQWDIVPFYPLHPLLV